MTDNITSHTEIDFVDPDEFIPFHISHPNGSYEFQEIHKLKIQVVILQHKFQNLLDEFHKLKNNT